LAFHKLRQAQARAEGKTMYDSSEAALADHSTISIDRARAELKRHGVRILDTQVSRQGVRLQVTNDIDPAEWIESTPAAILAWLGY
jgi:hypothetical protein